MTEYEIEYQLRRWGNWSRGVYEGAIRAMNYDRTPTGNGDAMSDAEGLAFDRAVASLRGFDKDLFDAVRWYYIFRMPHREIARHAGRPKTSVQTDLEQARMYLIGYFVGVEDLLKAG